MAHPWVRPVLGSVRTPPRWLRRTVRPNGPLTEMPIDRSSFTCLSLTTWASADEVRVIDAYDAASPTVEVEIFDLIQQGVSSMEPPPEAPVRHCREEVSPDDADLSAFGRSSKPVLRQCIYNKRSLRVWWREAEPTGPYVQSVVSLSEQRAGDDLSTRHRPCEWTSTPVPE